MSLRRIITIICLCCMLGSFTAVAALSEPRQRLEQTINQVLAELSKPALHDPQGRTAVLQQVENIIQTLFDFRELSMRTVGPNWKNFTPDEQDRFVEAFTTLLRESYLEKLDGYDGEKVEYIGETTGSKGDKAEIRTSVNVKDKPVPVSYRMLKKQQWVVYDIIIEGVSMVQNYRSQFQDLLNKGDAEALIAQVNVKAQEMREHNKRQQIKQ